MKTDYVSLFPKIVGKYLFDEHEKYEKDYVEKCLSLKSSIDRGGKNWINQTVYNTENNYDLNGDYKFKALTTFFHNCAIDYCTKLNYSGYLKHTNSFFNIYSKGDYQDWHDHPGTSLSGIYCLSGEKGSADIFFTDFNFDKIKFGVKEFTTDNSSIWKEEFKPGKFLLFRSDLLHCVNRHELETNRFSIATNFSIQH